MRAMRRIGGCTYRDVLLEFGSPTAKLAHDGNVHGPSGGRVTSWYWELPAGDDSLYVQFDAGVAFYSMYGDATRAKKYLSEMGK